MLNVVVLQGRLTADPELRQTPQGVPVCRFSIAVERAYRSGEERKTDFINITAWRSSAEFVSKYFHKGSAILVEGRIQTGSYVDKDTGKNRTSFDVIANNIHFGESKSASAASQASGAGNASYSRPAAEPAAAFSAGSADDFAVIEEDEDLPF